jgi:hypothetical protein
MSTPEIEKLMNQIDWQENTLLEREEQPSPANISHTNTPQVKIEKKSHERIFTFSHRSFS